MCFADARSTRTLLRTPQGDDLYLIIVDDDGASHLRPALMLYALWLRIVDLPTQVVR